jgi:hypothetical protein
MGIKSGIKLKRFNQFNQSKTNGGEFLECGREWNFSIRESFFIVLKNATIGTHLEIRESVV